MTIHPVRAVGVLPEFHTDLCDPIPLDYDVHDVHPIPSDAIPNDPLHASLTTSFDSEGTSIAPNENQLRYTQQLNDDILDTMVARLFDNDAHSHTAELDIVSADEITSHTTIPEETPHALMAEIDFTPSHSSTSHRDAGVRKRVTDCSHLPLGRKRVIKKGKRSRAPARPWTEEEHQRFEESLELFGRNWEQCAAYIGTRRAQLVRSHAQKHLIKLWKLGKPLPKKVAESGTGYTLSGKPLLADSASARSYLTKIPCPGICHKSL